MTPRARLSLLAGLLAAGAASGAPPDGLHALSVAAPSADGAPKEVAVLADLPAVKIVAITLRAGTPLPQHSAPVPVTLEAAYGTATVTVGGQTTPLGGGAVVVLDAHVPHAVTPTGADPVLVLVHHHKGGGQ